jgi:DNA-binding SARP family transcriptional activator/tetratricopeptide (TPR) repeat protein
LSQKLFSTSIVGPGTPHFATLTRLGRQSIVKRQVGNRLRHVIQLVTLGSLQLLDEKGPLLAGRRKILAMLACLVRRSPDPVRRAELAALFWNDRNETYAKQSLRQALAELRPILGEALLTDADSVLIDASECRLDVNVFEEAIRTERWEEAAHLWGGDFLAGTDAIAGETWTNWLLMERAKLREQAAKAFRSLYEAAEKRNDRRAAMEWSQKWCDVAPSDEAACTARINALVKSSRPVDAAVAYEGFVRRNVRHATPSKAFEALKDTFATPRPAATDKVAIGGTVTLSGLTQLRVDARDVAEAAAVINGPADIAALQAISKITSFAFKSAVAELVQHGIMKPAGEGRWEFTSDANRDQVLRVLSRHRRENLERAVADRFGPPEEGKTRTAPKPPPQVKSEKKPSRFRPQLVLAAGIVGILLFAGGRWVAGVATASAVELEAGSTVLLAQVPNASDPTLAGAVNTAAALGLSQSRHVALYKPKTKRDSAAGSPQADRLRALAKRERIPRIIALDITGTDSALRVAARLIDGSSGEVLGEETVDTRRARLVDDLDRLLRKVRVTLGESEEIVRDSSRLLREVGSASIEALSAYAEGLEAFSTERPDQARAAWTKALRQDSSFALAELALANDAFRRDDPTEGDRWVRRAITHSARLTALDALRARQMIALRDGRLAEASTLAEEIAKRAPSSQAWYDVAMVHVAADRCPDAVTAFERALASDSTNTRARVGLVECALNQGNAAVALRNLDAVRRIDSAAMTGVEFSKQRGRVLARAGRFAEADTAFRAMLGGSADDSASAFRWIAQSLIMRGRYGEALPHIASASRLARQTADVQALFDNIVLEANAYTAIGGRTRASELIDEAVAVSQARPVTVSSYFQLGHLMARIGRLNGAREVLRQASARVAQEGGANQWPIRLLTASLAYAERNVADALTNVDAPNAPVDLEPFRLALSADANERAGQLEAALESARRLSNAWHFGDAAQDEWLRATLRIARVSEAAGDTATARASYRKYVDRWKEADVFLVELSIAQRSLVRLGGPAIVSNTASRGR